MYPEGTHFLIPWFERPTIYDVRARPYIVEGTSGSHDLQTVSILALIKFTINILFCLYKLLKVDFIDLINLMNAPHAPF